MSIALLWHLLPPEVGGNRHDLFLLGWDWVWVMAFTLVSCFFEGWNMTGHS